MAFYNDPNENEDQNQASGMNQTQAEQSNGSAPVQLSGQSATVTSSAPAGQAPKTNSSGSAPGFQNYVKANQGQAQNKLNSAVAQNVANQGQAAKSSINQANTAFNQQVDAGSLANRQNALQDVSNTVSAARNLSAGAQVAQDQQNRFKEVINAKYQGPESLRQAGLYNKAADKVNTAANTLKNTGTATGREEILKNMYQQRADYNSGLGKLDSALLNASQQGVQNLQNTAKAQGNVKQQLDQAQVGSAQTSQNRSNEINTIRNQAKDNFTQGKKAEEAATAGRLDKVVQDWNNLPDYFKKLLGGQTPAKGQTNLNALEAGILGVQSGEGLYNLGGNAIATTNADKQRLISKDEQARQAALSALAGFDQSNQLDTNLRYNNAALAGTQKATDALDLAGTRANLNAAEKNFRENIDRNVVGMGSKKNKTSGKRYYAEESANLKDLLSNAGYDFNAKLSDKVGNANLLENLAVGPDANGAGIGQDQIQAALANVNRGDVTGDPKGLAGAMDATVGRYTNMGDGENLVSTGADVLINSTIPGLNVLSGGLGLGSVGQIAGSVFGGGANSRASKNKASQLAYQDLDRKVKQGIDASGFQNRFAVSNDEATNSRSAALQELLSKLDKTNIG